jgi:hypothetical protein
MRLRLFTFVLALMLWATPAFSQGCAMCYSAASGAGKDGLRAINRGVLVLLAPPIGFMVLGVGFAFRYGRKRDEEEE